MKSPKRIVKKRRANKSPKSGPEPKKKRTRAMTTSSEANTTNQETTSNEREVLNGNKRPARGGSTTSLKKPSSVPMAPLKQNLNPTSQQEQLEAELHTEEGKCKRRGNHGKTAETVNKQPPVLKGCDGENKATTSNKKKKTYNCEVCGKCCGNKRNLTNHLRKHTGETLYECNVCKKTFKWRKSLFYHRRTHTRETSYECEFCEKVFRYSQGLANHRRTHTGETPYECKECGKRFKNTYNMKRHMRMHTEEKSYKCGICEKAYRGKNGLDNHCRKFHGDKSTGAEDSEKIEKEIKEEPEDDYVAPIRVRHSSPTWSKKPILELVKMWAEDIDTTTDAERVTAEYYYKRRATLDKHK